MKPDERPYCAFRVSELQDRPAWVVAEVVRLRRSGYPPVTARCFAMMQTIDDLIRLLNETGSLVPEAQDGVLELLANRGLQQALENVRGMLTNYGQVEARQAKPRPKPTTPLTRRRRT